MNTESSIRFIVLDEASAYLPDTLRSRENTKHGFDTRWMIDFFESKEGKNGRAIEEHNLLTFVDYCWRWA